MRDRVGRKKRLHRQADQEKKRVRDRRGEESRSDTTDHEQAHFSFRYINHAKQSIRSWTVDELHAFFDMLRLASNMTWIQIKATGGGKGGKSGLGFTTFAEPPFPRPSFVGEDESISEMRVSRKARIFGVRRAQAFYVIEFDRSHSVFPS